MYVFVGVSEAKSELLCTAGVPCTGPHAIHQWSRAGRVPLHYGYNIRWTHSTRFVGFSDDKNTHML